MTSSKEPLMSDFKPFVENRRTSRRGRVLSAAQSLDFMRYDGWSDGPHKSKAESVTVDRGSRRRLRRITLRGNWSVGFWLFVLGALVAWFFAFFK
jgi:hypothetical protein